MNLDSCAGCHSQPDIGGSSPAVNPQMEFASKDGGKDTVPPFLSLNGPVREARFVRNPDGSPDGGVHALFTVSGRSQAGPCKLEQPDFAGRCWNVVFRIPTPTFGAGLIEMIPIRQSWQIETPIRRPSRRSVSAGARIHSPRSHRLGPGRTTTATMELWRGLGGRPRTSPCCSSRARPTTWRWASPTTVHDGAGRRSQCDYADNPNSITDPDAPTPIDAINSIEKFTFFMRFLAPPTPSATTPGGATSITNGKGLLHCRGMCAVPHSVVHDWKVSSRSVAY